MAAETPSMPLCRRMRGGVSARRARWRNPACSRSDATVVLGPGCADPYSPKAVRASMGSIFARPPARAKLDALDGHKVALDSRAERELREVRMEKPVVLVLGSERGKLPSGVEGVRIPVHADSLNVAMAATVALYEVGHRMAAHG